MKLSIGFGHKPQEIEIDDSLIMGILEPNEIQLGLTGEEEVKDPKNPIGTDRLSR